MKFILLNIIDVYALWAITFWQAWPFTAENVHAIGQWPAGIRTIVVLALFVSSIKNELITKGE